MNTIAILVTVFLVLSSQGFGASCSGKATYKLTFDYKWTSENFKDTPASAHFSPLTALSHHNRFSAFSRYCYATPGIQEVAETGSPFEFATELETAKDNKEVLDYATDGNVPAGDGSASVMVEVSCRHRYVSAITMIAPSPDWILAIFRLNVVRRGAFVKMLSGKLRAYDAGTDSGKTLTAKDLPSNPRENIAPLGGAPFFNRPVATYKLEKM